MVEIPSNKRNPELYLYFATSNRRNGIIPVIENRKLKFEINAIIIVDHLAKVLLEKSATFSSAPEEDGLTVLVQFTSIIMIKQGNKSESGIGMKVLYNTFVKRFKLFY